MLKRKINKSKYDKLSDELKALYKEDGDDFILEVEKDTDDSGKDDTAALKRAKDREKQRADELEAKVEELTEKLDSVTNGDARKKGDIETLEKAWTKKEAETKQKYEEKLSKKDEYIKRTMIEATVKSLASSISTTPKLMENYLRSRVTVDFDGDEPTIKILDTSGKVSDSKIEDLKKEIIADKEFSGIIIGSKATGGSAEGGDKKKVIKKDSASHVDEDEDKKVDLSKLSGKALAERLKAKREQQQQE